jgi:hypothetical protein
MMVIDFFLYRLTYLIICGSPMESLERRTNMAIDTEAELKTGTFEELAVIHIDSIYRFALLMVGNKHDAIISLPIKFRIFILLADVEKFSYKEISYIIGCSIEIVKSALYRGHRLLNKKLQCYAVHCGYVENQQYIFNL